MLHFLVIFTVLAPNFHLFSSVMQIRAIQEAFVRSVAGFLRSRPDLVEGNSVDSGKALSSLDWSSQVRFSAFSSLHIFLFLL